MNGADIALLVAMGAIVIVANIIGFTQGYRHGIRHVRTAAQIRHAKRSATEILFAFNTHKHLDTSKVHWTQLPRFLRRDAQAQEWAARRRR